MSDTEINLFSQERRRNVYVHLVKINAPIISHIGPYIILEWYYFDIKSLGTSFYIISCVELFLYNVTLSQLVLWCNSIERSNNDMFKARILQVPSCKLKHLKQREKQIKLSNKQIRIEIRPSKHKTYKIEKEYDLQFNKNIISKVFISDPRQNKPSLVPKSSSYQDVLLDCSE